MKRRRLAITALVLGLTVASAGGASAWTFATTTSPQNVLYDGTTLGQGAGNIYRSGYSNVLIDVKLRDKVPGGTGIYQQTTVWKPASPGWTPASTQTGRRTVDSRASMAQKKIITTRSCLGHWASSKVCEDAPWRPDICSTTKSSAL